MYCTVKILLMVKAAELPSVPVLCTNDLHYCYPVRS